MVWFGYTFWTKYATDRRQAADYRAALATARVWIATAQYRTDHEGFKTFRDSILKEAGITRDVLFDHLNQFEKLPEQSLEFTRSIKRLVDSLYIVEIERIKDSVSKAADSAVAVDTGKVN